MADEFEGDIVPFRSKGRGDNRPNKKNDDTPIKNYKAADTKVYKKEQSDDLIPGDLADNIKAFQGDEKDINKDKCDITGEIVPYKKGVVPPGGVPGGVPGAPPADMSVIAKILEEHHLMLQQIARIEEELKDFLIGGAPTGIDFEFRTSTTVDTPEQPATQDTTADASTIPPTPGYDFIDVNKQKQGQNAKKLWIVNDGPVAPGVGDNLFVRVSPDGKDFSPEFLMIVGETRLAYNVYEVRIRSPKAGNRVRLTEREPIVPYVTTVTNTLTPVENRSSGITRSVPAPVVTVFPIVTGGANLTGGASIPIPDSFSIVIRANVDNAGNSRVYVAFNQADVNNFLNRITLAPGDAVKYIITDANLIWIAGSTGAEYVDWTAEQ